MASRDIPGSIVEHLKRKGTSCTTLEIGKALGKPRKELNRSLYELQRRGVISKIQESPPLWNLAEGGQHMHGLKSVMRLAGAGRARSRSPSVPGTGYSFIAPSPGTGRGNRLLSPSSFQNQTGTGRGNRLLSPSSFQSNTGGLHTSPPTAAGRGATPISPVLQQRISAELSKQSRPITALELAQSLGFTARKHVNPTLYDMESRGLVSRDQGKVPPRWLLHTRPSPPVGASLATTPKSMQEWAGESSPVEEAMSDELADERDGSCSNEESSDFTRIDLDLSHIPMESIQQRLTAVFQHNLYMERTDLELAKLIGSTRSAVRPVLNYMLGCGHVIKMEGFPPKWRGRFQPTTQRMDSDVMASSDVPVAMETETTPTASTSKNLSSMITDINRNPVSALSEYCQANRLVLTFQDIADHGPPHQRTFVIAAVFGNRSYRAEASCKKEAKRKAADLALQELNLHLALTQKPQFESVKVSPMDKNFPDKVAELSHTFYTQVQGTVETPQPGRKVIAAFVMEDTSTHALTVVSVGSGTQCITGEEMSMLGAVVNDSHAEVIARRSLVRFLYRQLLKLHQGSEDTVFVKDPGSELSRVKDTVKLHLYISTAPCGDGAQFSRGDDLNRQPPSNDVHAPTMLSKLQGLLRTKMEGGEGTIPISADTRPQTWDGIQQGGRLRTMSCSDKVARWNILGLQGALLSHFMEPVYMSTLTLGSLHHHGHLSRAVCCRLGDLDPNLPGNFRVNHPSLGRIQGGDEMKRHTEKTSSYSLNWAYGDEKGELNDGRTGRPVSAATGAQVSRVSKSHLFKEFLTLANALNVWDKFEGKTYKECKEMAADFQVVKATLYHHCEERGYGMWMRKPMEQEQFDNRVLKVSKS